MKARKYNKKFGLFYLVLLIFYFSRTSDNFKRFTPTVLEDENACSSGKTTPDNVSSIQSDFYETPTNSRKRKADFEVQLLETVKQLCSSENEDGYDFYGNFPKFSFLKCHCKKFCLGKSIAARLRQLNPRSQHQARMKIEEILWEAEDGEAMLHNAPVYTNL